MKFVAVLLALILAISGVGISALAETGVEMQNRVEFDAEITEITGGNLYNATLFLKAPTEGEQTYSVLQAAYASSKSGARELERVWVQRIAVSPKDADANGMFVKTLSFNLTEMQEGKDYTVKAMVWKKGSLQPEVACETSSAMLGVDFIKNGSFEADGHWASSGYTSFSAEEAMEGSRALRFILTDDSMQSYCVQEIHNFVPGTEHTFSFSLRTDGASRKAKAAVKFEVYDKENVPLQQKTFENFQTVQGEWTAFSRKITFHEKAAQVKVLLRWFGKGTAYFDEVALKVPTKVFEEKRVIELLPAPYEGAEELIENGGFETVKNNRPASGNWVISHTWSGNIISITDEAHTGNHAVKIQTSTGGDHFIRYLVPITPHTEYVISSFIKPIDINGKVAYAFEFYTSEMKSAGVSYVTPALDGVEKVWNPYTYIFTAPAGAAYLAVLTRLYGTGTMYVDDLTAYAIGKTPVMELATDEEFYYTEWNGNVKATGTVNTAAYPELISGKVKFSLLANGEKKKDIGQYSITNGKVEAQFPIVDMETVGQEYVISAEVYASNGTAVGTTVKSVYRYNRPTLINADNKIEYNGTVFTPVYFYHGTCTAEGIRAQKAYGANTIIIDADYITAGTSLETILDICERENMKAILATYLNMKAGGHPDNIANTKIAAARIKDHPALLGYLAADEPYTTIGKTYAEDLHATYRAIRDIDTIHPVITNEASPSGFSTVAKRCDIITHDPYVGENANKNSPATFVSERMTKLREAEKRKPILAVLQAFRWGMNNGANGIYTPTADELRHMTYQSLASGAVGVAYYSFSDADHDSTGKAIPISETAWGPGLKTFSAFEQKEALAFFAEEKYPTFCSGNGTDYAYYAWVHDGDIYLVILNRDSSMKEMPSYEISIPLISDNEAVVIGEYEATLLAGGAKMQFSGTGTLSHTLKWRQAAFYKITPENPIDTEKL